MGREIKFRAWDIDEQGMRDWGNLLSHRYAHIGDSIFNDPDLYLMQFTGLHDKNGKEIYEGDIVHCWIDGDESIFDVEFTIDRDFNGWEINPQHIEDGAIVIGNIHEHPELLK